MIETLFTPTELENSTLDLSPDLTAETLQKNVKSVNLLLKAPIYLASAHEKNLTIEMLVTFAAKIIPFQRVAFYLLDEQKDQFDLVFNRGFSDHQLKLLNDQTAAAPQLKTLEKPLLFQKERSRQQNFFEVVGCSEVLLIPVSWQGGNKALWQLFASRPGSFTPEAIQLFWLLSLQGELILQNLSKDEQTQKLAVVDALTGLYNRRYFDSQLKIEVERAQRRGDRVSLLMIDIDNFKKFNDLYGHQTGDQALQTIGRLLPENFRAIDTTCRYGGEEFTVILPNTDHIKAFLASERLRKATENQPFTISANQEEHLTLSIGIATYPESATSNVELVKQADQALYEAKRLGKNRSIIFSPQLLGDKDQAAYKKWIDIGAVDFFMGLVRSLNKTNKILFAFLHSLFPRQEISQCFYLEIDQEQQNIFFVPGQNSHPTIDCHGCMPLACPVSGEKLIADWQKAELLPATGKQQFRKFFPVAASYPWEETVFRYPHRFAPRRWGWVFLFFSHPPDQDEFLRQIDTIREELAEAITLISTGIRHDLRQQEYYRLATKKLLSLSEGRLPYYRQHSDRVSRLLADFSRHLGLAPETIETLVNTAYFYDLGLLSIKTDILMKNSPLTEQEIYICQQHPLLSWEIARFSPLAIHPDKDAVLYHHECFDGSGYPEQLAGTDIPLTARILSLVDSYTAMTEKRPYRQAIPPRQALKEISYLSGSKFDPVLTREFCKLVKTDLTQ